MTTPNEDNADLLSAAPAVAPSVEAPVAPVADQDAVVAPEVMLESLIKDEALKGSETAKKFKDVDSVIKGYDELQKKLGSRLEDLSKEDLMMLNSKFNVPESIEGYEFEDVGDNATISDLRNMIVEAKLSKEQAVGFDKILRQNVDTRTQDAEYSSKLSLEDSKSNLKAHYGLAYNDKVKLANEALHEIADDEQVAHFKAQGFTSDPEFVKALAKMGEIIGEDKLEFKSKTREFNMDPTEINDKISTMIKEHGTGTIARSPDLKKRFAHLHTLKAQYMGL